MKNDRRFSRKRFKALIHYIISSSGPMDEEKLCWILWHCDTESWARTGKSITGATYIKGEKYPLPCHR